MEILGTAFQDKMIYAKTTKVSRSFFQNTGGIVHLPKVLAPPPNPLPSVTTTEIPTTKCEKCETLYPATEFHVLEIIYSYFYGKFGSFKTFIKLFQICHL